MVQFPLPVDEQGNEWQAKYIDFWNDTPTVALEFNLPPYVLWALFMAESGESLESQERWHIWTAEAKRAIAARNKSTLQGILQRGAEKGTNDFSFGVGHRAWRWSELYNGKPYDVDSVLEFRKRMIQDHGYAMRDAARTLKANWDKTGGNPNESLYLYNKPDGSASDNVKANYNDKLMKSEILWNIPDSEKPDRDSGSVAFENYQDTRAGVFASTPRGCILHGSRSGRASNPIEAEYAGTANWCLNNPAGLGWNGTVGEYKFAVHLPPDEWGWNARDASSKYLAVEFAQPVEESPISVGQIEAFCRWWVTRVCPRWPDIPDHFPTHADVEVSGETGQIDGKTDVFQYGSGRTNLLREAIGRRLSELRGGAPKPIVEDEPLVVSKASWERMVNGLGYLRTDIPKRIALNQAEVNRGIHNNEDLAIAAEISRAATEAMS